MIDAEDMNWYAFEADRMVVDFIAHCLPPHIKKECDEISKLTYERGVFSTDLRERASVIHNYILQPDVVGITTRLAKEEEYYVGNL